MNQLINVRSEAPFNARQRVRTRVTTLLGTRRFLALPPQLQNAIVPRAVGILGALKIGCTVTGSGQMQTRNSYVEAYDSISLGDGFTGTVIIGERYALTVQADDNLMAYVRILQSGSQLSLHLDGINHRRSNLKAVFTMPRLSRLSLRGGSRFVARELVFDNTLSLEAFEQSELTVYGQSRSQVEQLILTTTGKSRCSVNVSADESLVEVSRGARTRLQGEGLRMKLYVDQASHLDANQFELAELSFRLSGDSSGTVSVRERATGRVSGNSNLKVKGACSLGAKTAGNSSITRYDAARERRSLDESSR